MSNNETRKSMDDVLASIRRIVRSERAPRAEDAETADEVDDTGEAPLALTPEMMSDEDEDEAPPSAARVADFVNPPERPEDVEPMPRTPTLTPVPESSDAEIRDIVREVILEELSDGDAAGLVRDIIKAELTTGEIGANISRNVLRLIKSEIGKAKD